uniref:Bm13405 n=1 Tax=Brugia malayi TaxID=6279 RepID=A0A1I9G0S6_BRUMA|nr:Bm13405 [Brugia malayi]
MNDVITSNSSGTILQREKSTLKINFLILFNPFLNLTDTFMNETIIHYQN